LHPTERPVCAQHSHRHRRVRSARRRQEHPRPRACHTADAAAALARRDQGSPIRHAGLRRLPPVQAVRSRSRRRAVHPAHRHPRRRRLLRDRVELPPDPLQRRLPAADERHRCTRRPGAAHRRRPDPAQPIHRPLSHRRTPPRARRPEQPRRVLRRAARRRLRAAGRARRRASPTCSAQSGHGTSASSAISPPAASTSSSTWPPDCPPPATTPTKPPSDTIPM
jgi:hypothetical protein